MARQTQLTASCGAVLLVVLACTGAHAQAGEFPPAPVPTLEWQNCTAPGFDGFECTTAQAPLDYARPNYSTIELAVVRLPASGPASERIGTLFFNPGGPGGSGLGFLRALRDFFPAGVKRVFDLVSWDPRGIGNSTAVQCFNGTRAFSEVYADVVNPPFTLEDATNLYNTMREVDVQCAQRNGELLNYVSTADTARDMDLLRQAVGEEQLSYWGTSYGTLLGSTYANLFPDRVRAMILDGCVDVDGWFKEGLTISNWIRIRTDKATSDVLEYFMSTCGDAANTTLCPFTAGSYAATRAKWVAIRNVLLERPIGIPDQGNYTMSQLVGDVRNQLYIGAQWPALAAKLQALWENRNGPVAPPSDDGPPPDDPRYDGPEQGASVYCGEVPRSTDLQTYWEQGKNVQQTSGEVAAGWAWLDSLCFAWPGLAVHRYPGPFNKPTNATILVIGNTLDPATAYVSSVTLATDILNNARLLTVDAVGHTVLINISGCAQRLATEYLVNGTLPEEGTVCAMDCMPFTPGWADCVAQQPVFVE